uniref:Succinylglutamate desuccinylase/Aspartoacylase catalytic domain-containing protein n=1 Tax=Oncorhynchus tshawytscha TaxID=74940 RepID=A0A8C8C366_ONCTS
QAVLALLTVSRVAVCGGSLANELSGVHLVRQRPKRKTKVEEDDHVSVVTVMYNPRSVQQCQRYMETDLNLCFTSTNLRSQELNSLLSPKGSPESMDLVFDLHNTTANMGLCLIAYSDCDWIFLHIYRYLQGIRANDPQQILKEEMESNRL